MASFSFSRLAENDPLQIGSYTSSSWGAGQALHYMGSWRPVANGSPTIRCLAVRVIVYDLVFAA